MKRVNSQNVSHKQKTILVVDDDFDIANTIKLWLQRHGFTAHRFTDPILAFQYFRNNVKDIDMVVSDIRMPKINGCELVNKIKAIQSKIKVILVSAFEINYLELKKAFPEIKIDSLVSKPISLRNLQRTIDRHSNQCTIALYTEVTLPLIQHFFLRLIMLKPYLQ